MLARTFPTQRVPRLLASIVGALAAVIVFLALGSAGYYNVHYALSILPALVYRGFALTLWLTGAVIPLGFGLGLVLGWARTSRSLVLRGIGALYVDFFRSMPPIVLIALGFLIGTLWLRGSGADPYTAETVALDFGVLGLALHTAAYQAEIVRAGILSVPAGQTEAADAIGMGRGRTMFLVILPQAFRVSLPALGNEFSAVIKDTSLLSVIGWLELSGIGLVIVATAVRIQVFAAVIVWLEVAVFYFLVTFAVNTVVRGIEEAVKVPGIEGGPP